MKIRWLAAYFETKVRSNGANGAWTKSEEKVKGLLQVEYLRVVFHYLCFSPRAVNLNKSYPAGSPPRCKIASVSVSFGSKAMHKKLRSRVQRRRTSYVRSRLATHSWASPYEFFKHECCLGLVTSCRWVLSPATYSHTWRTTSMRNYSSNGWESAVQLVTHGEQLGYYFSCLSRRIRLNHRFSRQRNLISKNCNFFVTI